MNPIKLLKIYTRANRLVDLFTRASSDWDARKEQGLPMSKSLFLSKTFWFNALTAVAELTQVLPLPVGTVAVIATVVNVGLRFVTDSPVHVLPKK
ncbi:MAG: hypothetical protein VW835_21350 [Rickettsiales bacterium]